MVRDIHVFNEEMIAAGARIFAGGLSAARNAKSLRAQPGGKVLITDGPYLETKEHIGGFWILEAASLDDALGWGRKAVVACRAPVQMTESITAAIAKKELPPMESGAMCYMLSKQGYGGDSTPHWPPHLMFFYSDTDPAIWGANLPGSPVVGMSDPVEHLTQFVIPVQRWSDGTEDR